MFSGSLFSLGIILPLLLLFIGHVAIALLFSTSAFVVRLRADSELTAGASQRKIDWAIAILAGSALLSVVGATLIHLNAQLGIELFGAGLFLLWPLSAVLSVWGRGTGREPLLVGHGLIALSLIGFLICVWIFERM
jgi:hypothetical protein